MEEKFIVSEPHNRAFAKQEGDLQGDLKVKASVGGADPMRLRRFEGFQSRCTQARHVTLARLGAVQDGAGKTNSRIARLLCGTPFS